MASSAQTTANKRALGRPRRLTLEAIIDAACEIGLDRVEMGLVAERLGVGVATLYGYVKSRDHLVQLVGNHLAHHGVIADRGQSWQDVLREHAETTFQVYCAWPQLIGLTMSGLVGGRPFETDYFNTLLALMTARGVPARDALGLYFATNQLVIGAAVGAAWRDSLVEGAGGEDALVRQMRGACEIHDLEALRQGLEGGGLPSTVGDYKTHLERMMAAQAEKMAR